MISYSDYLLFLEKNRNSIDKQERIIITKHFPCITLGKNSSYDQILTGSDLPVYKSNRGGGAAYHDLGQLMLYPLINLKSRNLNISEYINLLHVWAIQALKNCGVVVKTGLQPGLWNESGQKVAFIGLAVKNGWAEHGIAFNLKNCSLENYSKIIPCNAVQKIGVIDLEFDELAFSFKNASAFDVEFVVL